MGKTYLAKRIVAWLHCSVQNLGWAPKRAISFCRGPPAPIRSAWRLSNSDPRQSGGAAPQTSLIGPSAIVPPTRSAGLQELRFLAPSSNFGGPAPPAIHAPPIRSVFRPATQIRVPACPGPQFRSACHAFLFSKREPQTLYCSGDDAIAPLEIRNMGP